MPGAGVDIAGPPTVAVNGYGALATLSVVAASAREIQDTARGRGIPAYA